jgi:phosphatidate cytidylyltransferase
MIKRTFDIKDSSNIIPGHGGFFDRFDTVSGQCRFVICSMN